MQAEDDWIPDDGWVTWGPRSDRLGQKSTYFLASGLPGLLFRFTRAYCVYHSAIHTLRSLARPGVRHLRTDALQRQTANFNGMPKSSEQGGPLTRGRRIYKQDDSIVARYAKTSLWYAAVVVDINEHDLMIKVKWLDGDKVGDKYLTDTFHILL